MYIYIYIYIFFVLSPGLQEELGAQIEGSFQPDLMGFLPSLRIDRDTCLFVRIAAPNPQNSRSGKSELLKPPKSKGLSPGARCSAARGSESSTFLHCGGALGSLLRGYRVPSEASSFVGLGSRGFRALGLRVSGLRLLGRRGCGVLLLVRGSGLRVGF